MKILVSGATGLVGQAIFPILVAAGHEVRALTRGKGREDSVQWNVETGELDIAALQKFGAVEAIIHLAGENIAARRWSAKQKERIRESRVEATRNLVASLVRGVPTLKVFVGASAIGFYGDRGDEVLTEASAGGNGFLPEVCAGWEAAAELLAAEGVRVAHLRFGMVLDANGGALAKMLPVFRMGLGGRVGNGEQWMSWISLGDTARVIQFVLMENSAAGVYNAVAPEPVRNREFTATLAKQLRRPAVLPLPGAMVRLLFGEMGEALLLSSARVVPERLQAAGFRFQHRELREALEVALEKN